MNKNKKLLWIGAAIGGIGFLYYLFLLPFTVFGNSHPLPLLVTAIIVSIALTILGAKRKPVIFEASINLPTSKLILRYILSLFVGLFLLIALCLFLSWILVLLLPSQYEGYTRELAGLLSIWFPVFSSPLAASFLCWFWCLHEQGARIFYKWVLMISTVIFGLLCLYYYFYSAVLADQSELPIRTVLEHQTLRFLGYSITLFATSIMIFLGMKDKFIWRKSKFFYFWFLISLFCIGFPILYKWSLKQQCLESGGKWNPGRFECVTGNSEPEPSKCDK